MHEQIATEVIYSQIHNSRNRRLIKKKCLQHKKERTFFNLIIKEMINALLFKGNC